MFDVVCIGILVADVMAKPVDRLPSKGKLRLIDSIKLYSGGCAVNTAIDIAKLNGKSALLGLIGEDGFGKYLSSELTRFGVNTEGLILDKVTATSASVVLSGKDGERSFLHCLGANALFSEKNIDYRIIESSKIVFVAGSFLMPEFDGTGCAKTLINAKKMGKITALDTAWDDTGRWMTVLEPCMKYVDYFMPSLEEAKELSGQDEPEKMAEIFFEKGVKTVIIKLGAKGCFMQKDKTAIGQYFPALSNVECIDTTGAGDSFCAGFLYGLSHDMPLDECCRLANAVGALCVMETGASTGIKTYEETLTFMEEYGCE